MDNTQKTSYFVAKQHAIEMVKNENRRGEACISSLCRNYPQFADGDADIDWLRVCAKTKNFTKLLPIKIAEKLIYSARNKMSTGNDYNMFFSAECSHKANVYLEKCSIKSKRQKRIKIATAIACAVLSVGVAAGVWYGDYSGLFYGEQSISFTADGQDYTQKNAVKYNNYVYVSVPIKRGYDVVGIIDTNTQKQLFDSNGKSMSVVSCRDLSDFDNYKLEVVYTPHVYSAQIMASASVACASITYTVEDEIDDVLDEPQQLTGYTFDGWYTDGKYKRKFTGSFADYMDITEPLVLYPHYDLKRWAIDYDFNGADFVGDYLDEYDILTDVLFPSVSKTGYKLKGWALDGEIIDRFSPTAMCDATLTAVWEAVTYTITYELNGGTLFNADSIFTIEDDVIPEEPIRQSYSFGGWYINSAFTLPITKIEAGTIGDKTFYAKWIPITYPISYDLCGGENSSLNPTSYSAENVVELQIPHRVGYTFIGWYLDDRIITELNAVDYGSVCLVAKWRPNEYTITVNPNNGEKDYVIKVRYGESYVIPIPSRTGYTFVGFSKGDAAFASEDIYNCLSNISVIADYAPVGYSIIYVSDGVTVYRQSVGYGQPYKLYYPDARVDYEFVGWNTNSIGGDRVSDGVYIKESDTVLYAVWTKIKKINLKANTTFTIDSTISKIYVIGDYNGHNSIVQNVNIMILTRNSPLTMELHSAAFKGKNDTNTIDCQNFLFDLLIVNIGVSRIEGGNGSAGEDGEDGSFMTEDNCNGGIGKQGKNAINAGCVVFSSLGHNSSLTLVGGNGGRGGNGGVDTDRSRAWLNYKPNGGRGGNSGAALCANSYSIGDANVKFVQGYAGFGGSAGSRGDWWCEACYGEDGESGKQVKAISTNWVAVIERLGRVYDAC